MCNSTLHYVLKPVQSSRHCSSAAFSAVLFSVAILNMDLISCLIIEICPFNFIAIRLVFVFNDSPKLFESEQWKPFEELKVYLPEMMV